MKASKQRVTPKLELCKQAYSSAGIYIYKKKINKQISTHACMHILYFCWCADRSERSNAWWSAPEAAGMSCKAASRFLYASSARSVRRPACLQPCLPDSTSGTQVVSVCSPLHRTYMNAPHRTHALMDSATDPQACVDAYVYLSLRICVR